jgi:hypothetical protein
MDLLMNGSTVAGLVKPALVLVSWILAFKVQMT